MALTTTIESFCERRYLILIFLTLLTLFTIRFAVVGYGVGGDGEGYYAYLPSIIINHNLNFEDQYLSSPWINSNNRFMDRDAAMKSLSDKLSRRTLTGHVNDVFPIGSAILWSPFFIFSLALTSFLNLFGFNFSMDGYSAISQYVTMLGSIIYATVGFLLVNRLVSYFGIKQRSIILSIYFVLAGTFAIQYLAIEPSTSHSNDFFIITLFFYYFYNYFILMDNRAPYINWILFGLICGFMVMVRPQNLLFLFLPLANYLDTLAKKEEPILKVAKEESINCCLFFISFIVSILPLLFSWKILYGSFITVPQGSGFLHPLSPQVIPVLFSFSHGLLTATPIIFFSLFGFILLFRDYRISTSAAGISKAGISTASTSTANRKLLALLLFAFLLQLYMNSIAADWWAGDAFGARRFTGLIFIFVLGLAYLLESAKGIRAPRTIYLFLFILTLFNLIYLLEYDLLIIPRSGAVTYLDIIKSLYYL